MNGSKFFIPLRMTKSLFLNGAKDTGIPKQLHIASHLNREEYNEKDLLLKFVNILGALDSFLRIDS